MKNRSRRSCDSAASEVLGGVMLISVVVMAVAIIGVVLTSQGTPQKLPAVSAIISSTGDRITIYHDGGDTLQSDEISILVNGVATPFDKVGSPAPWTWTVGDTLVNETPIAGTPQTVRVIYVHGAYTLASANFGEIGPGPSQTIVTPTATSAPAPVVTGITPSAGVAGTTVSGASVTGANFQNGATVRLTRSGYPDITGTSVVFVSANQLTATFSLAGASAGQYTVVVRNPDGQTGTPLSNGFTVSSAAPTVTAILPATAYSGVPVQIDSISGTNFLSGATVRLSRGTGTITATNVTVVSSTRISCTADLLGAASGQWNVTVVNPDLQSGTGINLFTVQAALPPSITSIMPNSGNRGWNVSITNLAGANFQQGATVQLRRGATTITATNVTVLSPSQITCTFDLTGAATGMWDVRVINPDAQAGTGTGLFTVYSPAPAISGITPYSGIRGWPVQISALSGSDFQPGATVQLRRSGSTTITATNVTVVSGSLITCTFDLGEVPTWNGDTRLWDVRVTNTDTQFATASSIFTVTNYRPTATLITPNTAQRTTTFDAVITGTGFQPGVTSVQLRGPTTISATNITVVSPEQITCRFTIPITAGIGSYYIRVTNPGGRYLDSGNLFTVTAAPAPAITSIVPDQGRHMHGGVPATTVTITGTNIFSGARVYLYRSGTRIYTAPAGTVTPPNQIVTAFSVPTSVAAGPADVRVTNTDGQYYTLANGYTILT